MHMSDPGHLSTDVPTIVIPYRDRSEHLRCILARLGNMPVIVVEQCDDLPFNRGSLLNVGYCKARDDGARRVILHDVDLVPDDPLLKMYSEPWPRPVVHFGARFTRYNNSAQYFGGVHGFVQGYFPGYPNHFFGWGGEDDALRRRVRTCDITYARRGVYLDLEGYAQPRQKLHSMSKEQKCNNRWELLHQDAPRTDNHREHTLDRQCTWTTKEGITWGCITHRREA